MVGSAASGFIAHDTLAVDDGQGGVVSLSVYVKLLTPEGVKVAYRLPFISERDSIGLETVPFQICERGQDRRRRIRGSDDDSGGSTIVIGYYVAAIPSFKPPQSRAILASC